MSEAHAFGEIIAKLRRDRGLKLVAVSRKLPASTISAIERGIIVPSPQVLDFLTDGFGLPRGALDLQSLSVIQPAHQQRQLVSRLLKSNVASTASIRETLLGLKVRPDPPAPIIYFSRKTIDDLAQPVPAG